MASFAALPVEGFRDHAMSQRKLKKKGRRENDENQVASVDQMIDELCTFIEAEGGELRADRIASFYQTKPPQYRHYFMREGLRNVVHQHEDRLTWDGKDFIRLVNKGAAVPGGATGIRPGSYLPKKSPATEGLLMGTNTSSQLIHLGSHCVVRKHSTMGCAVVGFGNEQLVGCILSEGPHIQILGTRVNISAHVDNNSGTGFVACSLFAAWGPEAEAASPLSAQLLASFLDALVLRYISCPLAHHMSNPALAAVRSLVHYIAATQPAKRSMDVCKVDDFIKYNPEYRSLLHRRMKALCECFPQWLVWWQMSTKECLICLGPEAIAAEFGESEDQEMLDMYSGDGPFGRPSCVSNYYDHKGLGMGMDQPFAKEVSTSALYALTAI